MISRVGVERGLIIFQVIYLHLHTEYFEGQKFISANPKYVFLHLYILQNKWFSNCLFVICYFCKYSETICSIISLFLWISNEILRLQRFYIIIQKEIILLNIVFIFYWIATKLYIRCWHLDHKWIKYRIHNAFGHNGFPLSHL